MITLNIITKSIKIELIKHLWNIGNCYLSISNGTTSSMSNVNSTEIYAYYRAINIFYRFLIHRLLYGRDLPVWNSSHGADYF